MIYINECVVRVYVEADDVYNAYVNKWGARALGSATHGGARRRLRGSGGGATGSAHLTAAAAAVVERSLGRIYVLNIIVQSESIRTAVSMTGRHPIGKFDLLLNVADDNRLTSASEWCEKRIPREKQKRQHTEMGGG